MDFRNSLINKNDEDRSWLENLCQTLASKKNEAIKHQAYNNITKYADFQCNDCGSPYTKDYLINKLAGVCDKCNSTNIQNLCEEKEKTKEKMYQCTNCDKEYPKEGLKKCTCGANRFVSKELLEQVATNTAELLISQGSKVEDVWFEKGSVFASIVGVSDQNIPWKTIVMASGTFTKNDAIMYRYEDNETGGHATVATFKDDPLIKFAANEKCQVFWETEQADPNANIKNANITDSLGNELSIGDSIEWRTPKSAVRGEIVGSSENGEIEVGITYDEYGPANNDRYASVVKLSQNAIDNLKVEAI